VCRGDEITAVDVDVAHRRARQIELQRLPQRAVVRRVVDARLRSREEQSAAHRVLADRACVGAVRDASRDRRPRLAEIGRLQEIRFEIVQLISVRRYISRSRIEMRRLDDRDAGELGERWRLGRHLLTGYCLLESRIHPLMQVVLTLCSLC